MTHATRASQRVTHNVIVRQAGTAAPLTESSRMIAGKYTVSERLSKGTDASRPDVVYKAETLDGQTVVIREVSGGQDTTAHQIAVREIQAAQVIANPRTATYLERIDTEYGVVLVRTFIEGKDLRQEGIMIPQKTVPLFLQACDIVSDYHSKGIALVDGKPDQFILKTGTDEVWLCETGGASQFVTTTQCGGVTTYARAASRIYTAPESASFGLATPQCDVYSLGCILAFMITGKDPEFLNGKVSKYYIDENVQNVQLREIIRKATQLDPDNRYQTVAELKRAIQNAMSMMAQTTKEIHTTSEGQLPTNKKRYGWTSIACSIATIYLDAITKYDFDPYVIFLGVPATIVAGVAGLLEARKERQLAQTATPKAIEVEPAEIKQLDQQALEARLANEKNPGVQKQLQREFMDREFGRFIAPQTSKDYTHLLRILETRKVELLEQNIIINEEVIVKIYKKLIDKYVQEGTFHALCQMGSYGNLPPVVAGAMNKLKETFGFHLFRKAPYQIRQIAHNAVAQSYRNALNNSVTIDAGLSYLQYSQNKEYCREYRRQIPKALVIEMGLKVVDRFKDDKNALTTICKAKLIPEQVKQAARERLDEMGVTELRAIAKEVVRDIGRRERAQIIDIRELTDEAPAQGQSRVDKLRAQSAAQETPAVNPAKAKE